MEYYQKAINLIPDTYMDRYYLSNIYFQKKYYEKSKKLLKKVLEINGTFK